MRKAALGKLKSYLQRDRPWAHVGMSRREYEGRRAWAKLGMDRAAFEAMILAKPSDYFVEMKRSAAAQALVDALFRG